ncbi:AfsR/SARP family transcriptional regulator [Puniceibacterium confluentis]|uniref:AfsR/SARP family transcriptional regulator n=1 Tax=Puniceibacterium confluentis TaxID=1958944 RepID=UPI0011B391E2|nr:transcriptional regulator [Puniceibacterium confluentis]
MGDAAAAVRISVLGPFKVTTPDGADITPPGAKNQALLAILALTPGMNRPRRWLEDKLWSTFGPEQASANLRQALSKLRGLSPALGAALQGDRTALSLNPALVTVEKTVSAGSENEDRELLEGLDVRDPEFEDWLRAERTRMRETIEAARPRVARGVMIECRTDVHGADQKGIIGDILANQIGQTVAENVRAWRRSGQHTGPTQRQEGDLQIGCDLMENDGKTSVFIKIVHIPTGQILYSKLHALEDAGDVLNSSVPIAAIVFEAADRVVAKLPLIVENARPEARATALARLALYRMFSFEPDALREADSLLSQAHDVDQNGIYLGWRSLVRMIQLIELLEDNPQALREEAAWFNQRAIEDSMDNSLVQALVAQVRVMGLGDAVGGMEMADLAVEQNPSNGFAWTAKAMSHMRAGAPELAIKYSTQARQIARFSPFRQWWEVNHCVVNIACNNPAEAIAAGEAAARAAPSLRPAHRHLLALYALDGQMDKALATAEKLSRIEPGFTLDRFVNDETYPVRTLRAKGLLEPIRALL